MSTGNFGHLSDKRVTGLWIKSKLAIDENCNFKANDIRTTGSISGQVEATTITASGDVDFEQNLVVAGETVIEGNLDVMGTINGMMSGGTGGWTGNANSDLDMTCFSIVNVSNIEVETITSKSGSGGVVNVVGDLMVTGDIMGNIMDTTMGNVIMANVVCADEKIQTNLIEPKSGDTINVNGNVGFLDRDIVISSNIQRTINIGGNANATSNKSIAFGHNTLSNNNGTVSIGAASQSTANSSVALGAYSLAAGDFSVSIGGSSYKNYIIEDSNPMGSGGPRATGTSSISIGSSGTVNGGPLASAQDSISMGRGAESTSNYGIAIGASSEVENASSSVSIGRSSSSYYSQNSITLGTTARSRYSASAITLGYGASCEYSNYGISMGHQSTNYRSPGTICMGYSADVEQCYQSVAIGYNITGYYSYSSVAIGRDIQIGYNTDSVVLGNGAKSGELFGPPVQYNVVIGKYADANNSRSVAIGYVATTNASYGIAIGYQASTNAYQGVAIGSEASANGQYSLAIGYYTNSTGNYSVGMGYRAVPGGLSSVAIGHGAATLTEDEILIGTNSPNNGTAQAKCWNGQVFQSREWANTFANIAAIDGSGNIYKTSVDVSSLGMGGGGWDGNATTDLEMNCNNISNVEVLSVNTITPKDDGNLEVTITGNLFVTGTVIASNITGTSPVTIDDGLIVLGATETTGNLNVGETVVASEIVASNISGVTVNEDLVVLGKTIQTQPIEFQNGISIGIDAQSTEDSIFIGDNSGENSSFSGTKNIAIGSDTDIMGNTERSIVIGPDAVSCHTGAIVLGPGISSAENKLHLNFPTGGNVIAGNATMERPGYFEMCINGTPIQIPCFIPDFTAIIEPFTQNRVAPLVPHGSANNVQVLTQFQDKYCGEQPTLGGSIVTYDAPGESDSYVSGVCIYDFSDAYVPITMSMLDVNYELWTPFNENPSVTANTWTVTNTPIFSWNDASNVSVINNNTTMDVSWDALPGVSEYAVSVVVEGNVGNVELTHCYGNIISAPATMITLNTSQTGNPGSFWDTVDSVTPRVVGYGGFNKNGTSATHVLNEPPVNSAPIVNAGTDKSGMISGILMNGSVMDDGNPNPPGILTVTWSQDSGPGTAVFTNISSPTTNVTFDASGVYVLRLTANDGLLESSDTVTVTATSPGSMRFPGGISDFLSTSENSSLQLGTGSFTIEWFQKLEDKTPDGFPTVYSFSRLTGGSSGSASRNQWLHSGGSPLYNGATVRYNGPTPSGPFVQVGLNLLQTMPLVGRWIHVAICRTPSEIRIYFDGDLRTTLTNFGAGDLSGSTGPFVIGNWPVGNQSADRAFQGNITNFRIVKGSAIYSGSSISVPTSPLTNIAGTTLLMLADNALNVFTDSSSFNRTMTNNGSVTFSSDSPF